MGGWGAVTWSQRFEGCLLHEADLPNLPTPEELGLTGLTNLTR